MSATAVLIGLAVAAFGAFYAIWPERAARMEARIKTSGLDTSDSEVEPTPSFVALTRVIGIGLAGSGVYVAVFM